MHERLLPGYVALLACCVTCCVAQQEHSAALVIPKDDLAAFVDGMFDIQLKRDDAAGAVLLLQQNANTLLSRGYGVADARKALPMSPDAVVRGGALTMAVIAVAVLQQVEAGKLALDADVTRYVDIPVPGRTDGLVTLRELLTHTAGFVPAAAENEAGAALKEYLEANAQRRVYRAGVVHSFSPYGMALAAYVVERVSGEQFPEYVQRHIFVPLGMTASTLEQPLPAPLEVMASAGYGASTAGPLPPETLAPALRLSTTASDMGRFAVMLLGNGTENGHQVLHATSVQELLRRQSTPGEELSSEIPGMTLAFHEVWFNGAKLFGISGDTAAFHSELEVDPGRGLALFLAYNSSGHPGANGAPSKLTVYARGELVHGIFDRYQPFHPAVTNMTPTAEQESLVTGTLIPADEAALPAAARHPLHARVDPATHSLLVDGFLSDRDTVKRWPMLLPDLWQQYPQDRIFAIRGRNGAPDRFALAANPANELIREPE